MKKVIVTTAGGFNRETMQFEGPRTYEVEVPETVEYDLITYQGIKYNRDSKEWENDGAHFSKRVQKGHGYELGGQITSITPDPELGVKWGSQSHSKIISIVAE